MGKKGGKPEPSRYWKRKDWMKKKKIEALAQSEELR